MQLPAALARVNKRLTNPIQRLWAPHLAPWAMVEHTGRHSGRLYATPVLAWAGGDTLAVVLAYGRDTDWVRNVLAAGGCDITRRGKHFHLVRPRIIPADSPDVVRGARPFASAFRWVLIGTLEPA
ncbi:nitroreductase family deazaflavin-dependent oxidoreductase [Gordonia polyisoprenivorans]|uniref:nitroreductase family deazaflavin-dependent oxidoreductase n=1 Tax=Gordonia polyisoprenivorans TaxID=84595 RepID=UPI0022FFC851|nr:nitroreductase family deazaflavin-dependent oxidoreductase [Gordonia polyisoprenivorans]WCB39252.1 nitroreductase family deazaflavin-dependent oxidoreductase [Gordonia polyisoprenivorans]